MAIFTLFLVLSIGCLVRSQWPSTPNYWGTTNSGVWGQTPAPDSWLNVICLSESLTVFGNQEVNFKKVCGENGQVVFNAVDPSLGPWSIVVGVDDAFHYWDQTVCTFEVHDEGDITDQINQCTMSTTDSAFDGRDVTFSITVSDNTYIQLEVQNTIRRIGYDFSGVDIRFDKDAWVPNTMDLVYDCTFSSWMASSNNYWFEYLTVSVEGDLPIPTTGYMAAAYFLSDTGDIRFLGHPLKWSTAGELVDVWNTIKQQLGSDETQIFGSGHLNIDLDLFDVAWSQSDTYNDTLSISVHSSCYQQMNQSPNCSSILNPWTLSQSAIFLKEHYNSTMFIFHHGTFVHGLSDAARHGYLLLAGLQEYVMYSDEYEECLSKDQDLLVQYVMAVEQPEDPEDVFVNHELNQALMYVERLMNGDDYVIFDIATMLETLMTLPGPNIENVIAKASMNMTWHLGDKNNDDYADLEYYQAACNLSYMLTGHYYTTYDLAYYEALAAEAAKLLVLSKWKRTSWSGLRNLLQYITTAYQSNTHTGIFIANFYASPQAYGLVKRLTVICHAHYYDAASKTTFSDSKEAICKSITSRQLAKGIYRTIGQKDLRDYLVYEVYQGQVNNDVFTPVSGTTDVFEWRVSPTTGVRELFQGVLVTEDMCVGWTKIGVCTCDECYSGTTYKTNGPYTSNTWSPIPRK